MRVLSTIVSVSFKTNGYRIAMMRYRSRQLLAKGSERS
jgi:hypothetical protein